ncbi:UPF0149 family protein [Roseateles sp. BYS180W]|uniref:UPF0149 family protein n=1 Tax=Roseateles rivi TaxID=3299028 RepID=A0ABW7FR83_9BURK
MNFPAYTPESADDLPLSEAELQELDAILAALPDGAMNIEAMDGYLCALLLSPQALAGRAGADWIPAVWGGGDPFPSGKQRKRVVLLVLRHVHSLAVQLTQRAQEWEPIFSVAQEEALQLVDAEDWCIGFMLGVDLDGDAWVPLFERTKTAAALAPIALLGGDDSGLDAEQRAQLEDLHYRDALSREVPESVLTLWALRGQ